MNNFTLLQKQQLETMVEAGHQVNYVEYDPTKQAAPTPPAGWTEFYRETAASLVEIIYTK
jgi:hypothetical protein